MGGKMYSITVSEKQLSLIQEALESYVQIRTNQWLDFAEEIAFSGFDYDKSDRDNIADFRQRASRRNQAESTFEAAFLLGKPDRNYRKTENMMIADDIWTEIRHFRWEEKPEPKSRWTAAARGSMGASGEPIIKITRV